jgi:cytochrome P450
MTPPSFDPHDPVFLADPYPTYARLRDESPVVTVAPYGAYWVFGAADVTTLVTDTARFTKNDPRPTPAPPGVFGKFAYLPSGLFGADPPRHTELRAVLAPLVTEVFAGAAGIARATAQRLVEQTAPSGMMELVSDYAGPLPSTVLFTILGLDEADWPVIASWVSSIAAAHDITQSYATQGFGGTCAMAMRTYFDALIHRPSAADGPGLLAKLVGVIGPPGELGREDVISLMCDLTLAGYLSTTFLISTGLRNLLQNPAQFDLLRRHPTELMAPAVEEMLRFDAPAQLVDRVAAVETELGGVVLQPGDRLSAVLGSANHDPQAFRDPDRFIIDRDDSTQMSFSQGIHHCIGAPLARIVTPIAIAQLLELDDLAITGYPQWQTDPYLRGLTNLPLRFRRSGG